MTTNTPSLWPNWPEKNANLPNLIPGSIVLVPFCYHFEALLSYYQAGCKVIAANPNPLPLLTAQAKLSVIDAETLATSFAQLSNTLKRGQPLDLLITGLYQSVCPQCQQAVSADYFIWPGNGADPKQKHLTCPSCQFSGLSPVTTQDLALLDNIETRGLHYHFLLERTAPPESAFRPQLEWLHEFYTPRALYTIAEIIMKLETVITDRIIQRVFKAILLDCFLPTSNLFRQPSTGKVPQDLRPAAPFVERNIWHLFEQSVKDWAGANLPIRMTTDTKKLYQSPQNHILFFQGDMPKLAEALQAESIALVISQPPLETPLSAKLSALWGGWLLGKANLTILKNTSPGNKKGANTYWQQTAQYLKPLKFSLHPDAQWRFSFQSQHPLQAPALTLAILKATYDIEDWHIKANHHQLDLSLIPVAQVQTPQIDDLAEAITAECEAVTQALSRTLSAEAKFLAVWQSLLYSGLLAQAVQNYPANEVWDWLIEQIKTTIV